MALFAVPSPLSVQPRPTSAASLRWSMALPWLVLCAGLGITWVLWQGALKAENQRAQALFDFRVRDLAARLVQRMHAYEQVLLGADGLFSASRSVERAEFREYIHALKLAEHYPGIQGVGFAKVVMPEEKAEHIDAIHREGFPDYTLRPGGERELYTAIIYLEPFEGRNLRAFGYDMFAEPTRRAAMEQARDRGAPVLSGKVRLVQETERKGQAGVLLYVPVYRNGVPHDSITARRAGLVGWVYEPFRMNDLMAGIFGEQPSDLAVTVHDGGDLSEEALMYDDGGEETKGRLPQFSAAVPLEIAGRVWLLTIRSKPSFEAGLEGPGPPLIGNSGMGSVSCCSSSPGPSSRCEGAPSGSPGK